MTELMAIDLYEMFNAFADIGFAAAAEPENLNNTKEVLLNFFLRSFTNSYSLEFIFTPGLRSWRKLAGRVRSEATYR